MKVALFGGTGFVGCYLVDALLAHGHQPVVLVRPGSEGKVERGDACELVAGTIAEPEAVRHTVAGADAAIYAIGILKEVPRRGITFAALHFEGARRAMEAATAAGVKRFLLMSANGVKADGTTYQRTKLQAEQALQASGLAWTIFRPSVIFGEPRGRMEFVTQLYHQIVARPIPAPLFYTGLWPSGAGATLLSPIHVHDVAELFVRSLARPDAVGQILPLGGARALSWKEILQTIGRATHRRVVGLPTPAAAVWAVARLLDLLDLLPVTADQITMLMEGNTCDATALLATYGIEPIPFDAPHLAYLTVGAHS